MRYEVELGESAIAFIEEYVISERVYEHMLGCMELLGDYPRMGRAYDPSYAAARPPFPCRQLLVSDTPFMLFYTIDDEKQAVTVFHIEFAAGNPKRRFETT